ncbi:MAG: hypothetical protein QOJ35_3597 [Solirubrobacteraceae bacterium]|jgi:hypothetical protein|nr:hypothetical protein [Solirubrobacteraceae bacterium]
MSFVDRYVSDGRLALGDVSLDHYLAPTEGEPMSRADLVFYGVAHSRGSYEGRVFFNNPDADADTPRDHEHGYAGSYWVFGHAECYGDPGHCDPDWGKAEDAIDYRKPHHMAPEVEIVDVTEAMRNVTGLEDGIAVTVVAVRSTAGYGDEDRPPLRFDHLRLLTYA